MKNFERELTDYLRNPWWIENCVANWGKCELFIRTRIGFLCVNERKVVKIEEVFFFFFGEDEIGR